MSDEIVDNKSLYDSPAEKKEFDQWGNEDNAGYYEKMPVDEFRDHATRAGFEDGCDIELILPYIKNTKSLLDVGAAYGRAIHNLQKRGYLGEIFAIERSQNFFNYLETTFKDSATLFHGDIQYFNFGRKFDVILWLWSNISEWPKNQQAGMLKMLEGLCEKDGFVILDTMSHEYKPLNVTTYSSQAYIVESDYGYAYGYIPTKEEIKSYAAIAGLNVIEQIDYTTATKRNRILHILKK
ncbi:MAG: hypothetical protein ACNA7Y_03140 [Gammaproteobacteria bacterium]